MAQLDSLTLSAYELDPSQFIYDIWQEYLANTPRLGVCDLQNWTARGHIFQDLSLERLEAWLASIEGSAPILKVASTGERELFLSSLIQAFISQWKQFRNSIGSAKGVDKLLDAAAKISAQSHCGLVARFLAHLFMAILENQGAVPEGYPTLVHALLQYYCRSTHSHNGQDRLRCTAGIIPCTRIPELLNAVARDKQMVYSHLETAVMNLNAAAIQEIISSNVLKTPFVKPGLFSKANVRHDSTPESDFKCHWIHHPHDGYRCTLCCFPFGESQSGLPAPPASFLERMNAYYGILIETHTLLQDKFRIPPPSFKAVESLYNIFLDTHSLSAKGVQKHINEVYGRKIDEICWKYLGQKVDPQEIRRDALIQQVKGIITHNQIVRESI